MYITVKRIEYNCAKAIKKWPRPTGGETTSGKTECEDSLPVPPILPGLFLFIMRAAKRSAAAAPRTSETRSKRRAALAVAAAALAPAAAAAAAPKVSVVKTSAAAPSPKNLFSLGEDGGLVQAVVVQRPSARNKSPYVGDVKLPCGRVAIAHMPSMDMGGKCIPAAECVASTQVDKATGLPIGPDATGKYGTPKCEFSAFLASLSTPLSP